MQGKTLTAANSSSTRSKRSGYTASTLSSETLFRMMTACKLFRRLKSWADNQEKFRGEKSSLQTAVKTNKLLSKALWGGSKLCDCLGVLSIFTPLWSLYLSFK